MRKVGFVAVILLSILFSGVVLISGFCAEEFKDIDVPTKIVRGKVTYVNKIQSKITVKEEGKGQEITFAVTERTRFLKNNVRDSYSDLTSDVYISFTDIMEGDEIIVEYFDNPKISGHLAARSVELLDR